jgi:hypothetical protein
LQDKAKNALERPANGEENEPREEKSNQVSHDRLFLKVNAVLELMQLFPAGNPATLANHPVLMFSAWPKGVWGMLRLHAHPGKADGKRSF